MSIFDVLGKIKHVSSVASSILSQESMAETGIKAFFDRRFSSYSSYIGSLDSLIYKDQDDFPLLRKRKMLAIYEDNKRIVGYLYEVNNPRGLILCVHGLGGLADDYFAIIQNHFVEKGFDVLAIDLSASGRSDGLSIPGLQQSAFDVNAVERHIQNDPNLSKLPLFLFGFSWGAYGITASLNFNQNPRGVIALSGFYKPIEIMTSIPGKYLPETIDQQKNDLEKELAKRGEYSSLSSVDGINKATNTAILLIHGDEDQIVNLEKASIFNRDFSRPVERYLAPKKGHGNIFLSYDSIRYGSKVFDKKKELEKNYSKKIKKIDPAILKEFQDSFDKEETSQLDLKMFNIIDGFIERNL